MLLKLEISDAYNHLRSVRSELQLSYNNIITFFPRHVSHNFFQFHSTQEYKRMCNEGNKIDKKIRLLQIKCFKDKIHNIKSITYDTSMEKEETYTINISPNIFSDASKLDSIQDKWFINKSDVEFPPEVQKLLQLGDRFGLPLFEHHKNRNIISLIKNVENNIHNLKLSEEIDINIRNSAVSCINRVNNISPSYDDRILFSMYNSTKLFLKKHPEILVTRADKGNVTVALNHKEYVSKMEDLLSDRTTYEVINQDPLKKITNSLVSIISGWKQKEYIDVRTYKMIYCGDGNLPRAYGLPKIHKHNCPLRIIVSTINSPVGTLATFLKDILQNSIDKSIGFTANSYQLIERLNGFALDPTYKMVSLDVISLFTNIPMDSALNSIEKRWNLISQHTLIPLQEFKDAVKFVLGSTFFTFNKIIYKQIYGTPMGSPLSPVIADLVMQDLETTAIKNLPFQPSFYHRYVDDILLAAPSDSLHLLSKTFNSQHGRLQFTMEIESDKKISFLDLTFINEDGKLIFDLFKKPTFSGRFLNFYSNHPLSHKKGVIYGLTDKILKVSHPKFQQKNLIDCILLLLKNGYPLEFIFASIHNRIKKFSQKFQNNPIQQQGPQDPRITFFTVPFIKHISNSLKTISSNLGCPLAFTIPSTLNMFIKTGKDKIDSLNRCGVVYKINCKDCEVSYVGQTKRRLITRMKEHKNDINKKSGIPSVISSHRLLNHEFDWDKPYILDNETSWYKRIISEMIHIKMQTKGINKQSDTEILSDSYTPIINHIITD